MSRTNNWDETRPVGTDFLSIIDNEMRKLRLDIRELLAELPTNMVGNLPAGTKHQLIAGKTAVIFFGTKADINALTGMNKYALAHATDEKKLYYYDSTAWIEADLCLTVHILKSILTTQGDILIRGAADVERLPAGTSGQALLTQGSTANPIWGDLVPDGSVNRVKLKTASGSVSFTTTSSVLIRLLTLPGGEYGFYPQVWFSGASSIRASIGNTMIHTLTTPTSIICLEGGNAGITISARQRYVTASGSDHWIFILYDRKNNKIIAGWEAPDHPSYGQGGDESEIPHPFTDCYQSLPDNLEIILVDNNLIGELKEKRSRNRGILDVINNEYTVDFDTHPDYKSREIIEVDEWGDRKGEIITEIDDGRTIKRRTIDTLPANISYRRLKSAC